MVMQLGLSDIVLKLGFGFMVPHGIHTVRKPDD